MKNHKYIADIAVAKISKNLEKLQELDQPKAPLPKSPLTNKSSKLQLKQDTSGTVGNNANQSTTQN